MKKLPTEQENPKGLHKRFILQKANGEPIDEHAEYFILRLDEHGRDKKHIEACKKAVLCYANEIKEHLPKLSEDLIERYSKPNKMDNLQKAKDAVARKYKYRNFTRFTELSTLDSQEAKDIIDQVAIKYHELMSENITTVPYQLCPKCSGKKTVSKPQHIAGDVYEWSSVQVSFPCDICNQQGIIPMCILSQSKQ